MRVGDRWWTLVAPLYDGAVAMVGWHRYQDTLVTDVAPGPVLDVGCGPAHLCVGLWRRRVGYVGVDRNAAMLRHARRRVMSSSGRGALVRADVTCLPFRGDSIDIVVATGVLGLLDLDGRRAALQEMARVARREVRLLEPVLRSDGPRCRALFRAIALVRDRPLDLDELVAAGLKPTIVGSSAVAGLYSMVHATKQRCHPGPAGPRRAELPPLTETPPARRR